MNLIKRNICKREKASIRLFMQSQYSDEKLAMLLAHAQSGKLVFHSCCCFVGIATAGHALQSETCSIDISHLDRARVLPFASEAESAFYQMGFHLGCSSLEDSDARRRRRLIPMVKAEMRRRELSKQVPYEAVQEEELVAA